MKFTVIPYSERARRYRSLEGRDEAFVVRDNWDDFSFRTTFALVYFDREGTRHDIGEVKIMRSGMTSGATPIEDEFEFLSQEYFSLGQSQEYYETLLQLDEPARVDILTALRDLVWNQGNVESVKGERSYELSLMRSIGDTLYAKFASTLQEEAVLTSFNFSYRFPDSDAEIRFEVEPNSLPPTNIHVVIGRNGVGKTTLLTSMSSLLRNGRDRRHGKLQFSGTDVDAKDQFANLITVAFSAFDDFSPPRRSSKGPLRSRKTGTRSGLSYTYVGLKKWVRRGGERATTNKSEENLLTDFVDSTLHCLRSSSRPRWQAAMHILEADPLFHALGPSALADMPAQNVEQAARDLFTKASSGHKIVLLTLTRLAELVSERTLVLIDEPEAHLHPPLVMAFVRALSDLLSKRNGVAILATHSPVVVQEVPSNCVTLLFRPGGTITVERPEIETFGENLGALTRDIFRVQVTESGHHSLIGTVVAESNDLDELLERFGGRVGSEGRALARTMLRTNS